VGGRLLRLAAKEGKFAAHPSLVTSLHQTLQILIKQTSYILKMFVTVDKHQHFKSFISQTTS